MGLKDKCLNCKFFDLDNYREGLEEVEQDVHPGPVYSLCYRYPPVRQDEVHCLWPEVLAEDWCGEYKDRETNSLGELEKVLNLRLVLNQEQITRARLGPPAYLRVKDWPSAKNLYAVNHLIKLNLLEVVYLKGDDYIDYALVGSQGAINLLQEMI